MLKVVFILLLFGVALVTGLWQIDSLRELAHVAADGSATDSAGSDDFWDAYAFSPEGAPLPGAAKSERFPPLPSLKRDPALLRPIVHVPIA